MDFGKAIEALKQGKRVARKGWNGKGMFLWLKPEAVVKAEWCKDPLLKEPCRRQRRRDSRAWHHLHVHPRFDRKAVLTGWLASQSDILLEDWEILDDGSWPRPGFNRSVGPTGSEV